MEPEAELEHTLAVLRATAGVDKVGMYGNASVNEHPNL